jgi:predicted acylesterase/phospholipase RssA
MTSALSRGLLHIPSFGFSGAGFLTCYHFGVADCLLKHGSLLRRGELPSDNSPILTGVSGGALVVAAVSLGVPPEDGMKAILEIAHRTRQEGGVLDHLQPGYVTSKGT